MNGATALPVPVSSPLAPRPLPVPVVLSPSLLPFPLFTTYTIFYFGLKSGCMLRLIHSFHGFPPLFFSHAGPPPSFFEWRILSTTVV